MKPRVGDWVRVRSKEEILATLDGHGRLENMPFMPQMFQYCGQEFRVYKRAHKTCDTISGKSLGLRLPDGVHLNLRCDGKVYGGCQAECLLFWKEQWLEPAAPSSNSAAAAIELAQTAPNADNLCTEEIVRHATRFAGNPERYVCQATELLSYTRPLNWWDPRQFAEDHASGNASIGRLLHGVFYAIAYYGTLAHRYRLARPAHWLHDKTRFLWRGGPMPRAKGKLPTGQPTPRVDLNLQPGDLVRVKSFDAIRETIDRANYNRGLAFDAEMTPFCGKVFRVHSRVAKFIDERNGRMRTLKTPAVILDGVFCQSRYSYNRMHCPRSIYSWWREIWLERVSEPGQD